MFGVHVSRFASAIEVCLLLALALVLGSGSGSSSVGSSVSPSGVLLFADYQGSRATGVVEGVPGLYRINASGTSRTPLRGGFYLGEGPDWSPNGSQIVFARWLETEDSRSRRFGLDIVVASANGTAPRVLIEHSDKWSWPTNPKWSPDGHRIAFINTGATAGIRIFITDTRPRPFKTGHAVPGSDGAGSVSWSPSGDELLFVLSSGVYRVPVKGGTPRLVMRHGHSPVWSPDGRHIAYISDRGGVYVLDLQNKRSRLVTRSYAVSSPEWSPDGHWLAFVDGGHPPRPGAVGQGRYDLTVVKDDGTGRRVIFSSRSALGSPTWH